MKHPYAIKGCSHCLLRESCDLKDSEANLLHTPRRYVVEGKTWWSACEDYFKS